MSTETISPEIDRFSDLSTVVGVDKTREEYLKLFSRPCYSPQYDQSYSNPISGYYKAINTSTNLILLNQRFKYSHLREQILPEESPNPSQIEFDYNTITEIEQPKSKHSHKHLSSHIPIDPYRHFESIIIVQSCFVFPFFFIQGQSKYWHNRRCPSASLIDNSTDVSHAEPNTTTRSRTTHIKPRRSVFINSQSQSDIVRKNKYYDDPESFNESLCQYHRDVVDKSKQCSIKESSNQRLKSNGIRRKLPLTKGQQLYLLGKSHVYDIKDSKERRTNTYSQLLNDRFKADIHCKPQFRLNDPDDHFKYAKYLQTSRSSTSNSSSIKSINNKKQLINTDLHKSFTINNNNIPITIRFRQESKQITTISVQN